MGSEVMGNEGSVVLWGSLLLLGLLVVLGLRALTDRLVRRVEAAAPPEGRFIEIDGHRLHYVEEGEGPPLLLIHGLTGNGRNFTHSLTPALRAHFRVITLDRPGAGYSDFVGAKATGLQAQAAIIARFIEVRGLQQPLVLGHSLGGALALALASKHPQQVRALVLVAPLTHPMALPPLVFSALLVRPAPLRWLIGRLFTLPVSWLGQHSILQQVFGPDPVPADFVSRGGALLGLRPGSFYAASCELARINQELRRLQPRYAGLQLPIGLIHGTDDTILSYRRHAETLRGHLPQLMLELLPGRGHMLPVSAVAPVVALTRRVEALARSQ